jgi:hypothetical protein
MAEHLYRTIGFRALGRIVEHVPTRAVDGTARGGRS